MSNLSLLMNLAVSNIHCIYWTLICIWGANRKMVVVKKK